MAELDDAVHERIQALFAEGDALAKKAVYPAALKKYGAACLNPRPIGRQASLSRASRRCLPAMPPAALTGVGWRRILELFSGGEGQNTRIGHNFSVAGFCFHC